jgi:adenosylcobinamide-phosphate synthase
VISLGGLSGPALVLVLALVIEGALGPGGSNQVATWVEQALRPLVRWTPRAPGAQRVWGALLTLVPALLAAPAALLGWLAIPDPLVLLLSVALVRASLSLASLGPAVTNVREALGRGDLDGAREAAGQLGGAIPTTVDPRALVAASIAALARALTAGFVVPLLGYALFGVPGAIFCRAVGALAARLASERNHPPLGRAAARLETLVGWLPSWLTAALLVVAGLGRGLDTRQGLRRLRGPGTAAPARVLAGLLRVDLSDTADAQTPIGPAMLEEGWRTARLAAWVGAGVALLWLAGRHGFLL